MNQTLALVEQSTSLGQQAAVCQHQPYHLIGTIVGSVASTLHEASVLRWHLVAGSVFLVRLPD